MNSEQKPFFVKLPQRGQLRLEGEDTFNFLQDIITNDIEVMKDKGVMYSCLLNAQGKFQHDFFAFLDGNAVILDCEGGPRTMNLFGKLMMYRLRAKVNISKNDNVDTYVIIGDVPSNYSDKGFYDPRNEMLGLRIYNNMPEDIEERPFEQWDQIRIRLAIPDGSRDMILERSNMIESNLESEYAVSFTKGCYVGQELTARMHNRGLSKRHLYGVELIDERYNESKDIIAGTKNIGEIRSTSGNIAIASIKDAELDNLADAGLKLIN